jgi:hypothetical protein
MAALQKVVIFVWWLFWWLLVLTVWPSVILVPGSGRFGHCVPKAGREQCDGGIGVHSLF